MDEVSSIKKFAACNCECHGEMMDVHRNFGPPCCDQEGRSYLDQYRATFEPELSLNESTQA